MVASAVVPGRLWGQGPRRLPACPSCTHWENSESHQTHVGLGRKERDARGGVEEVKGPLRVISLLSYHGNCFHSNRCIGGCHGYRGGALSWGNFATPVTPSVPSPVCGLYCHRQSQRKHQCCCPTCRYYVCLRSLHCHWHCAGSHDH